MIPSEYAHLLTPLRLAASQDPTYKHSRHHGIIDYEFRQFIKPGNPTDILIFCLPPRHGKTWYLSRWAPTHYLLTHPADPVILCSYGMQLAKINSRWVRDNVHRLAPMYGLEGVDPGFSSAGDWMLKDHGGGMVASGVEGSVTGRGGKLILIDDYMRKGKDALSQTVRDSQWEWFQSTISTRRDVGGKLCILSTPWHNDDLIGRIMSKREELGLNVRQIIFQAIAKEGVRDPLGRQPGEALWPEQWPVETLLKQKKLMGPYWWGAQYDGKPGQYGGSDWPDSWFANIWAQDHEWPQHMPLSAVVLDPSLGKRDDHGDYQALCYVGFHEGKLWVDLDCDRRRLPRLMPHMVEFCKERRPALVGVEAVAFQEVLSPMYMEAASAADYHVTEPELISSGGFQKELRLRRLEPYFENRLIRIRRNSGGQELIREGKSFPNSQYDDALDALEMAIRLLGYLVSGEWHEGVEAAECLVA